MNRNERRTARKKVSNFRAFLRQEPHKVLVSFSMVSLAQRNLVLQSEQLVLLLGFLPLPMARSPLLLILFRLLLFQFLLLPFSLDAEG